MNANLLKLVVEFDLPFVMRLEDSFDPAKRVKGYLDYVATLHGVPAMLRFEKKTRAIRGSLVAMEDRAGVLNYSVVQVWFDHRFLLFCKIPDDFPAESSTIESAAVDFANRVIDVYRDKTHSYWVRRVSSRDIPGFQMCGFFGDGTKREYYRGTLGMGRSIYANIEPDQDSALRETLIGAGRVDDLQRLSWIVADLFDREEYWTAALAIEILFEAKVARMLRRFYRLSGMPGVDIDGKFLKVQKKKMVPKTISDLLTDVEGIIAEKLTSAPLVACFDRWKAHARNLRNEIAHGKTIDVPRKLALAAIEAVRDFLAELERRLPDETLTRIDLDVGNHFKDLNFG